MTDMSKVLEGVDASRRVGWARAYANAESADQLARESNILRAEREVMRRWGSYMYGFTTGWLKAVRHNESAKAREHLESLMRDLDCVLDSVLIEAGMSDALQLIDPHAHVQRQMKASRLFVSKFDPEEIK